MYSCLSYPARKAHAPNYIVIRALSGSTIFFTNLVNGMIERGEKSLNIKCLFFLLLFLQLLSETFIIVKRIRRDSINVCRSSCKVPVIHVR